MESPGRWAGGFRAWDPYGVIPRDRPGAVTGGRVLRCPPRRWAAGRRTGRRSASTSSGTVSGTVRIVESVGAAAGVAGRARDARGRVRARDQQPGVGGHPGRRRARRSRARRCSSSLGRLAERPDLGRPVRRVDGLRPDITPRPDWLMPLEQADREDVCPTGSSDTASSGDWLIAPPLAAAGAGRRPGGAGRGGSSGGPLEARPGLGRRTRSDRRRCWRRCRSPPGGLGPDHRVRSYSQPRPRLAAAHGRRGRPGEHAGACSPRPARA